MHFFGFEIDRNDSVLGVAFADRTWKIFLYRDQFIEIDALGFVDYAKPADA